MKREVLFATPFITVEYLPEYGIIQHSIHKPIGSEPQMLKEALSAGSKKLKEAGASKWLSDDRNNDSLTEDIIQWGIDVWQPNTINDGWKYWANVVPTEVVAAGALMPVIENLHKLGLRMRVFTNVEEALAWLNEVE